MSEFPTYEVKGLDFAWSGAEMTLYFHQIRWYSFDGLNEPQEHTVQGPAFRTRYGKEEDRALEVFSDKYHLAMKEFPPCDLDQVKAELSKRKHK